MNEIEQRLEVLCQCAALLILKHPERSSEVEAEIATAFHVQPVAVHDGIVRQIRALSEEDQPAPALQA